MSNLKKALKDLFVVPMRIKPKARPRAAVKGWYTGSRKRPWAQIYMPSDYTLWMKEFRRKVDEMALPAGPVGIAVISRIRMPVGWSKKRRAFMEGKPYSHNRYDVDNNLGSVMDALFDKSDGGDGRVAEAFSAKLWGVEDSVELCVYELLEGEDAQQWEKYVGKQTKQDQEDPAATSDDQT